MHTVRTRRLLREICGPDTGSMTMSDRETAIPLSLVAGVTVVVMLSGCQQSGTANVEGVRVESSPNRFAADLHEGNRISKAHALAAKNGSDTLP